MSSDPFSAISRLYCKKINCRENSFLLPTSDPTINTDDGSKIDYELQLTLLPHQVLIIPRAFAERIKFASIFDMIFVEKEHIR